MRIVIALLRRGQPLTAENQHRNIKIAAEALAPIAREHDLVISHGNGPQVGLLAQERKFPFLAIETDGNAFPHITEARLEALCLQAGRLNDQLIGQNGERTM